MALAAPAAWLANVIDGLYIGGGLLSPHQLRRHGACHHHLGGGSAGCSRDLDRHRWTSSYPAGRQEGVEISDGSSSLNLSVLQKVSIHTYLAGVLQQSATPQNNLLHLQALGLLTVDRTFGFAGFTATKPSDAVDVKVTQVGGPLSMVKVYRACVILQ